MERLLQGLPVSSGVAVGSVWLLDPPLLPVVPEPIPPERVQAEVEAFERARLTARGELAELGAQVAAALGEDYAGILAVQRLIVEDPRLGHDTVERIRAGRVSASWALKEAVAGLLRRFARMPDAYLRERGGELEDVHRRLQRLLRWPDGGKGDPPGNGPLIAVAHNLGPSDAVSLARMGAVGLASDVGGRTSHTAILAQALGVPAVAGLHDASRRVRNGQTVVLDGDAGTLLLDPDAGELAGATRMQEARLARERESTTVADFSAVTLDGASVTLRANIEFSDDVEAALRAGAQGIGLYRSEFLFLTRSPNLPTEDEHFETYAEIAEGAAPHPAVVRTLDLGGEKYFHEVLERRESNPVLGLRAVRLCLARPDIFRPQLRGLLRAATRSNLRIMLPLVVSLNEIREVRRMIAEEAEALKGEGTPARADVPLGIMVEVPAAAVAADILAREVDFLSIGTNDLIQYSLAVDRGNESVAYLYQPLHPGLLRMVRSVLESGRRRGIPVSLCGEMGADPALTALLVGLGVREISMQPRALCEVREAVRRITATEAARLADDALLQSTADDVARCLGAGGRACAKPSGDPS